MKKTICILIGLVWFVFSGFGQSKQHLKPVRVGDVVPEISMGKIINYSSASKHFREFRGKLLILDFWATWCGSCIQNFPKMENLQRQFGNQIQIIGVTNENGDKVKKFLSTKAAPNGHKYKIPSFIGDKVLSSLFPHRYIPHCVWIGVDGKVKAITGAEEVTASNIAKTLNENNGLTKVKKDLDTNKPLFLSTDYPDDNELLQYSILSKGTYRGYPEGGRFRTINGLVRGRAITNSSLLSIYEQAIFPIFQSMGEYYTNKRLLLDIKDLSKITRKNSSSGEDILENNYNYDIIVPLQKADSLYWYMLRDLNRYSGYTGSIKKMNEKCLILIKTDNSDDKIRSKGGAQQNTSFDTSPYRLINSPLSYLILRIDELKDLNLPVLDETNYKGKVDLIFRSKVKDLNALKAELRLYNLDLVEAQREIDMFILSDKQ